MLAAGPAGADPWSAFCLRQADRVLLVAATGRAAGARTPGLRGCRRGDARSRPRADRARVGGPPATRARSTWLGRGAERGARARLARRLAGRSIGVVLSSGGARGFAHIGVLEELLAAGVEVDRVGGCSMGAFVGAMFAMGMSPAEIRDALPRRSSSWAGRSSDYGVPVTSLLRGGRARSMLARTFGDDDDRGARRASSSA